MSTNHDEKNVMDRIRKLPPDFEQTGAHYAARTDEKMREVLMDTKAEGPTVHYGMYRGHGNVTIWEPGTIGGEYIKTYGHYHVGQLDETYEVLFGEGVAVLQKLATDTNGQMIADIVENIRIIPVKLGSVIYMPPGWGHLFANVGPVFFVTIDDSPVNFGGKKDEASMPGHADYELVKQMQGFAYYVVENNGKPALKKNPKYKEIKKEDLGGLPIIT